MLVGSVGCGRLRFDAIDDGGADDDATVDTPTACAPGMWGAASRVTELSSPANDFRPTLSADGLTVILQSDRAGSLGSHDLWISTRATPTAPFAVPVNMSMVNTVALEGGPTLSGDGLTLYFHSERAGGFSVYRAIRATPTDAFAGDVIEPGLTGYPAVGPDLSANGNELYFTQTSPSSRLGVAVPSGATWSVDRVLNEFLPENAGFSSTSGDGRTIYFSSSRPPSVSEDLWMATRPTLTFAYGAPVPVNDLNTDISADEDLMISKDDRTMMWSSDRNGSAGFDIFIATRSCL